MNGQQLNILVLDDNPDDRTLAVRALRQELSQALINDTVLDEAQFERTIEAEVFDVVVSDFQLKWSNGLKVLRRIKELQPETSVILFTNTGSEEVAVEGMKGGLDDYVIKSPSHYVRLAVAVRWALERRQARLEKRRAEEELRHTVDALEQANRLKDEFLATVSHELRTPLSAITGWASLLRMGKVSAKELPEVGAIIERNSRQQMRLIEDLLDVSKITAGRIRLDVRPVDLAQIVERALQSVQQAIDAKKLHLQTEINADAGPVRGDPGRLEQVMWNLLSNSVKFTPEGGWIRIAVRRTGANAEVSVTDSGEGIAAEFLPFVFDRFRQAESSTTRRHGGLGLGLGLVKYLVELHGGQVSVLSRGRGEGATFTVMLPVA